MKSLLINAIKLLRGVRTIPFGNKINARLLAVLMLLACEGQEVKPTVVGNSAVKTPTVGGTAAFMSFSTNGQTLPTSIQPSVKQVRLEIAHDADITQLTPQFTIPAGHTAYVNGALQSSGSSVLNFSQPVSYELRDQNNLATIWKVSVTPLGCKILIDASHDGGVWWFPQHEGTGFDPNKPHQGQAFADLLRSKGFEVNELGRGVELTEEMFFGHYVVIRAGGFQPYTARELEVYTRLISRGMNLVFFTDHKKFDPVDELGDLLGLKMEGAANGSVTTFVAHKITANLVSIPYIAGSVLTNVNQNPGITILGWLGAADFADLNFNGVQDANEPLAPPVMGILNYPKSQIFFIGDINGIQVRPQPFIDNLIGWMGQCF